MKTCLIISLAYEINKKYTSIYSYNPFKHSKSSLDSGVLTLEEVFLNI